MQKVAKSGECRHNKNSLCLVLVVEEEGFPIQLKFAVSLFM